MFVRVRVCVYVKLIEINSLTDWSNLVSGASSQEYSTDDSYDFHTAPQPPSGKSVQYVIRTTKIDGCSLYVKDTMYHIYILHIIDVSIYTLKCKHIV